MSRLVLAPISLFSSLLLLCVATSLCADTITPIRYPPGLEPSDQYRLFFTTSEFRDATSPDIDVYNDFVQSVADAAPVVGPWGIEWKAVASTSEVDARDNTGTSSEVDPVGVPIYLLDGTWVARTNLDLWTESANPFTSVHLTELGTLTSPLPDDTFGDHVRVFTGTNRLGTATSWRLGNVSVTYGAADKEDVSWFLFRRAGATNNYPFYAMSEVLTVPAPTSITLLLVALPLFAVLRKRRVKIQDRFLPCFATAK